MCLLKTETVIVTGASRGLGKSMAKRFAAEGANVVLTARSRDELESTAEEADGDTLIAPADVSDEAACSKAGWRQREVQVCYSMGTAVEIL